MKIHWIIGCLLGWATSAGAQEPRQAGAEIIFLDVGQGDAILIRSDTFNVLIDAGHATSIAETLNALGVDHLNLLIATHNHFDHIGGMDEVIRRIPVRRFIDNGCQESTEAQAYVEDAQRTRHLASQRAADTTFTFGALDITVIPSPFYSPACDSSQNNLSVGALVQIGRFRALLTGDSETYEENAWMVAGVAPTVSLLKAAHHGARNGVTPAWIQATNPDLVVISVGAENQYGHPEESALRYYRSGGRRVLRTDRDGTIAVCIRPDGEYQVQEHMDLAATCPIATNGAH
ncbi:MAG: MBL fold metallo-hydrolase [Gemmatimonadota bacterium]